MDYFKPGRQIPCCQLTAKFLQKGATSDPIPELYHLLSLEGAREPNNVVTIEIDPTRTLRDQARPIGVWVHGGGGGCRRVGMVELKELMFETTCGYGTCQCWCASSTEKK